MGRFKTGPLSAKDKEDIKDLYYRHGKTSGDISVILSISEKRIFKVLNNENTEEDEECFTNADIVEACEDEPVEEEEFTDSDWAQFWKDKYFEAHEKLLINGLA